MTLTNFMSVFIQDAKVALQIVIRMGRLIHKLQKERDMTILHVGKLGPGTKAFLLKNYEETDEAFAVSYINLNHSTHLCNNN